MTSFGISTVLIKFLEELWKILGKVLEDNNWKSFGRYMTSFGILVLIKVLEDKNLTVKISS